MDDQERREHMAAMAACAGIFDSLTEALNREQPLDLMEAYLLCLGALKVIDMDKNTLEKFVAVLMADRTHMNPLLGDRT
jgi:hypothetical protein